MYRKNAWLKYDDKQEVLNFAEKYKSYISVSKNERAAIKEAVKLLEANGFVNVDKVNKIKTGDRIYFLNKNKNVAAYIIGSEPLENGLRILGAPLILHV